MHRILIGWGISSLSLFIFLVLGFIMAHIESKYGEKELNITLAFLIIVLAIIIYTTLISV